MRQEGQGSQPTLLQGTPPGSLPGPSLPPPMSDPPPIPIPRREESGGPVIGDTMLMAVFGFLAAVIAGMADLDDLLLIILILALLFGGRFVYRRYGYGGIGIGSALLIVLVDYLLLLGV